MPKDTLVAPTRQEEALEAAAAIRRAFEGEAADAVALRALVDRLAPVVQARVARALLRRRGTSGNRDPRQEVEDMTQDVFVSLFRNRGQALRAWDPARGLSLDNFVGLLAQHQVASLLRNRRTSPWTDVPTETALLDDHAATAPAAAPEQVVASREALTSLLAKLRAKLSPRGLTLFWRLLVREEPTETVAADTGMTPDALYAWRSRLGRLARELAAESTPVERIRAGGER